MRKINTNAKKKDNQLYDCWVNFLHPMDLRIVRYEPAKSQMWGKLVTIIRDAEDIESHKLAHEFYRLTMFFEYRQLFKRKS